MTRKSGVVAAPVVTALPTLVTPDLIRGPLLRRRHGSRIKSGMTKPIWAVYPQRRHLLPKVRLLIDKLREELPGALSRSGPG